MQDPFWPQTLETWLRVAGFFGAVVGSTLGLGWALLKAPLVRQVDAEIIARKEADNGIGARVEVVEVRTHRSDERLMAAERSIERISDRAENTQREVGRIESAVQALTATVHEMERARLIELVAIHSSISELGGKLDLMIAQKNNSH